MQVKWTEPISLVFQWLWKIFFSFSVFFSFMKFALLANNIGKKYRRHRRNVQVHATWNSFFSLSGYACISLAIGKWFGILNFIRVNLKSIMLFGSAHFMSTYYIAMRLMVKFLSVDLIFLRKIFNASYWKKGGVLILFMRLYVLYSRKKLKRRFKVKLL